MKRQTFSYLAYVAISLSVTLTSCNKDEFKFSNTSISFTSEGGIEVIKVTSSYEWYIDWGTCCRPEWVEVSATENTGKGSITINVKRNESTTKRTHIITVATLNIDAIIYQEITVEQAAGNGEYNNRDSKIIEGLTLENFPFVDGSTSTDPLVRLVACKLFDFEYEWKQVHCSESWNISTNLPMVFVEQYLKSSQTHNAFINLIDKKADLIFSARAQSPDEKVYADAAGVSLTEIPIALDALIFIVNTGNPVRSLTHEQLQNIYTAKIKNWKEVGGNDLSMMPFIRNKNSGSQELMESLVFTEPVADIPEDYFNEFSISSMFPVFSRIQHEVGGLGYTIYYYKENIIRDFWGVKTLAVNGIYPNKSTIANREYPYTAEVYLIFRSDLDKSSMAYKVCEFLQTTAGKQIINESGYVSYLSRTSSGFYYN